MRVVWQNKELSVAWSVLCGRIMVYACAGRLGLASWRPSGASCGFLGFWRPSCAFLGASCGFPGPLAASCAFLGVSCGFLGFPGAFWGLLRLSEGFSEVFWGFLRLWQPPARLPKRFIIVYNFNEQLSKVCIFQGGTHGASN